MNISSERVEEVQECRNEFTMEHGTGRLNVDVERGHEVDNNNKCCKWKIV